MPENPHYATVAKLTVPQTRAYNAMRDNDGWAKTGDGVNRVAVKGLVDKGLAAWSINTPGGHWSAYLTEQATDTIPAPASETVVEITYTGAGDPIVHAAGCQHTDSRHAVADETLTVTSLEEIADHVYQDQIVEKYPDHNAAAYIAHLHVKPCAKHLPDTAPAPAGAPEKTEEHPTVTDPADTRPELAPVPDELKAIADKQHPGAVDFWAHRDNDDNVLGWTYRVPRINEDRYGWILTDGTCPIALEYSRYRSSQMLRAFCGPTRTPAADSVPNDIVATVHRMYPNAEKFLPHRDDNDTMLGWTFQVGQLHGARYGWVTSEGTRTHALEPYRSEAAALLPVAVLDDQRVTARRTAAATAPRSELAILREFKNRVQQIAATGTMDDLRRLLNPGE